MPTKTKSKINVLNQHSTDRFSLYHGDCVDAIRGLPDNSIDLTITSPPFCNLYTYSPSDRDMGNTNDDNHFMENFDYLIPELFRVTTPGRLCVIHCKDLPLFMGSNGVAGLRDFPGEIVRRFCGNSMERLTAQIDALVEVMNLVNDKDPIVAKIKAIEDELISAQRNSWVFHSRVTIWKCPKIEMERTNNHGLLHSQLCKDSSVSRQGMADYLLVFRKWCPEMDGLNSIKPVTRADGWRFEDYIGEELPPRSISDNQRGNSINIWRKYASPVWSDIKQTNVLNFQLARENSSERHICPLQLDVIGRCIELWSNPGDVVLDPFNGIGSTGWQALKMDRKYVGMELKKSYFDTAIGYLENAESVDQLDMDLAEDF
jgi:DNA modification methylase